MEKSFAEQSEFNEENRVEIWHCLAEVGVRCQDLHDSIAIFHFLMVGCLLIFAFSIPSQDPIFFWLLNIFVFLIAWTSRFFSKRRLHESFLVMVDIDMWLGSLKCELQERKESGLEHEGLKQVHSILFEIDRLRDDVSSMLGKSYVESIYRDSASWGMERHDIA